MKQNRNDCRFATKSSSPSFLPKSQKPIKNINAQQLKNSSNIDDKSLIRVGSFDAKRITIRE